MTTQTSSVAAAEISPDAEPRPPVSWTAVLPGATAALVVVLGGSAVTLVVLNGVSVRHMLGEFFVANLSAAFSFGVVGVLIVLKRPGLRMGWLCCGVAVATALSPFFANWARYALVTQPGSLPAGQPAAWLADWTWPLGYGLFLVGVPLLFPDGRLPPGRWRVVAWAGVVGVVLSMVGSALSPAANPDLPEVANPYGIAGAIDAAQAVFNLGTVLLAVAALGAIASMIVRFRHARGRERDQLRWLIFAAALLAVTQIGVPLGGLVAGVNNPAILGYVEGVAAPWLAVAIAVAVLRHRLYDIDIWINRTLVYGSMTAMVVAVYVLVVGYFSAELDVHGSAVGLAGAAVVAVGFHPVREWVQRAVNRALYGRRDEPYRALSDLGRRLEASLSPDMVLEAIADTVREALRVPYVRVDVGELAHAESGTPVADEIAERLALTFGAETVGELVALPISTSV